MAHIFNQNFHGEEVIPHLKFVKLIRVGEHANFVVVIDFECLMWGQFSVIIFLMGHGPAWGQPIVIDMYAGFFHHVVAFDGIEGLIHFMVTICVFVRI